MNDYISHITAIEFCPDFTPCNQVSEQLQSQDILRIVAKITLTENLK